LKRNSKSGGASSELDESATNSNIIREVGVGGEQRFGKCSFELEGAKRGVRALSSVEEGNLGLIKSAQTIPAETRICLARARFVVD
jgi:hypothetical protein